MTRIFQTVNFERCQLIPWSSRSGGSTSRRFGDRHPLGNLIFSFFLHKNETIRVILLRIGFENRFFSMIATPSLIFWIRHWSSRMNIGSTRWNGACGMFQILNFAQTTWSRVSFSSFFLYLLLQLGWNHRFNRLVAKYHPNVWYFFDCNDGWKQANQQNSRCYSRANILAWMTI